MKESAGKVCTTSMWTALGRRQAKIHSNLFTILRPCFTRNKPKQSTPIAENGGLFGWTRTSGIILPQSVDREIRFSSCKIRNYQWLNARLRRLWLSKTSGAMRSMHAPFQNVQLVGGDRWHGGCWVRYLDVSHRSISKPYIAFHRLSKRHCLRMD